MENCTGNSSFYNCTPSNSSNDQFSEQLNGDSIVMAFLYSIISFIAVFGNLLVITAVCWDSTLRSYTSNYFLANLAVADFFTGVVSMPLRVLEVLGKESNPNVFCRVVIPTAVLFGSSSNFAILVISIDRFLAVKYPYIYMRYATTKSVIGAIAFSWSIAVVLSSTSASRPVWQTPDISPRFCRFPVFLNPDYIIVTFIIVQAVPIGTVVLLYGFILKASLVHVRRIHAQQLAVLASNQSGGCYSNTNEDTSCSTTKTEKKQHRETVRQRKAARTVSIIVGFFIFLVVPIIAIDVAEMLGAPPAPVLLTKICVFMIYVNNCVNVLVYAGFNQDFRRVFKKILFKFVGCF